MKYILAIDQGTTSTRAVLFNHDGKSCGSSQKEFKQIFRNPGWVEHDAMEIWETVLYTVKDVMKRNQVEARQIDSIGITNQRETVVLWDKKTGQPVADAICWQSRQSETVCHRLKNEGYEEIFKTKTGLLIDPYFSATKIRWLFETMPGLYERACRGEICAGTIDTWLVWNMTGGRIHVTDQTNASRTLIYNIHNMDWDAGLMKILDIPGEILPRVCNSSSKIGQTDPESFLQIKALIGGIAGDQQAALFGQGCIKPGMVKSTYGTGCFMLMNTGSKPVRSRYGLITTLACSVDSKPQYALEGSVFIAGSAVTWLRDEMKMIDSSAESETLASQSEDNGGVYVVPAFTGLGAPYWDMKVKGAVFGLTRGTSNAQFVRATLESMAYQTRDVLSAMEKDSSISLSSVMVDGGAVKNNLLMQFLSDILAVNVVRPIDIETTVRGAAYLAGLASGFWDSTDTLESVSETDRIFSPEMKKVTADELYSGWQEAVRAACTYHR